MEKKDEAKSGGRGFWAIVKESMDKSSSGCGPGCGCNSEVPDNEEERDNVGEEPGKQEKQE